MRWPPRPIVIGDDDGVVVVPSEMAAQIAAAATAYLEKENVKRVQLRESYVPFAVADELVQHGYAFV